MQVSVTVVIMFLNGPPGPVNQTNFNKIKKGMTHDEVAIILGRHSHTFMSGGGDPANVVRVWGGRTDWRYIAVVFDEEDKVKTATYRYSAGRVSPKAIRLDRVFRNLNHLLFLENWANHIESFRNSENAAKVDEH